MPKIKINRNSNGSSQQPFQGKGLRSNQGGVREEITPQSEREREECFDMYRSDGRGRSVPRRTSSPRTVAVRKEHQGFQLWQAACLICALGAFCMFADCLIVRMDTVPVRLLSYEILYGNGSLSGSIPACSMYMALIPLVFVVLFGVFAYMKEEAFEKAYLALISVPVFVIVILFYFSRQVMDYSQDILLSFQPGHAMFIEIGCSILLAILVICQRALGYLSSAKTAAGWTR